MTSKHESGADGRVGVVAARALAACVLAWLSACGSAPPPVAPAVVAAEEMRLLQPFQDKRAVVADFVEVTLSPNFLGSRVSDPETAQLGPHANRVALPGIDKNLHERQEARGSEGSVETFTNKRGGVERPLVMLIGQTEYRALRGLRVQVLPGRSMMTLTVRAHGDVTVLAGSDRRDMAELEARDGVWRTP